MSPDLDDPFDDPSWQAFADDANARLVPMIRGSAISAAVLGEGELDIKQALEIGACLLLGKPLFLVVVPGAEVPPGLARAAEAIIEMGPDSADTQARLSLAIEALTLGEEQD